MALSISKQYELLGLVSTTARKIEAEARNVEPNLRRLVLLSNTYDGCASKVAEMFPHEDDCLAVVNQSPSEPYYSADDGSSSDEDPDEWDSSLGTEEAPPEYSLYTSPQVTISVSEYFSSDNPDDDDSLCNHVVTSFDTKNPGYYSTGSIRDSSNLPILAQTRSEHLTAAGAPGTAKAPREAVITERCQKTSKISRLLHGLRAMVT